MSKKPGKSRSRTASKAASPRPATGATKRPSPPSDHDREERIARALAYAAYDARTIRLVRHDLIGMSHLVATRRGLFAVNEARHIRIAHGSFFGLTLRGNTIFAFETCDLAGLPTRRGRIVRPLLV